MPDLGARKGFLSLFLGGLLLLLLRKDLPKHPRLALNLPSSYLSLQSTEMQARISLFICLSVYLSTHLYTICFYGTEY